MAGVGSDEGTGEGREERRQDKLEGIGDIVKGEYFVIEVKGEVGGQG